MTGTVLDRAHRAMEAAPEEVGPRLRFYERLADAELFVLLEAEATADRAAPRIFALEEGRVVLAFDREERLATFVEGPAIRAEMTGRQLVPLLAEAGLGLGLNLGVAPSAFLLPAEGVRWLAGVLAARPGRVEAVPEALAAPASAPRALLEALEAKLPGLAGLARHAVLADALYAGGGRGLLLAFAGVRPGAEDALARAAGEALAFSGLEAGALDVAFPAAESAALGRLERVGLRLDIPAAPMTGARAAPGMDPDAPPRLR